MIDLVLKYAGIPSGSIDDPRFSSVIEATNAHLLGSGNKRCKTGQAQTAFKEGPGRFGNQLNHGVRNHVKRDFASSSLFQFRLGESFVIFGLIFNHGKLQRLPNLRCSKTDSRRITKSLAHVLDEVLNRRA